MQGLQERRRCTSLDACRTLSARSFLDLGRDFIQACLSGCRLEDRRVLSAILYHPSYALIGNKQFYPRIWFIVNQLACFRADQRPHADLAKSFRTIARDA